MCHTELSNFNYLESTLNEYSIGGYVIAHEVEPYSHFHFLVEMTEQDYTRFRKRVFIDKLKLSGKATSGNPRQYGKVANIDDFDKMLSYTVKDSNIRSNLSDELLNDAIDKSFKKQQPKLLKDKMTKYVDDYLESHTALGNSKKKKMFIMKLIIQWLIQEKIPIRKTICDNYYQYYRQFTRHESQKYNVDNYIFEMYKNDPEMY